MIVCIRSYVYSTIYVISSRDVYGTMSGRRLVDHTIQFQAENKIFLIVYSVFDIPMRETKLDNGNVVRCYVVRNKNKNIEINTEQALDA